MTVNELRTKRNQLWEGTKAFLESHRNEKGVLSAEDDATYTRMEQDISDLGREIDRMERQQALDAELALPVNKPITQKPEAQIKAEPKTGRGAASYKANFWNVMRSKNPSREILNALTEGTDGEGGYLVPDEYEHTLVKALEQNNIFRSLAHIITTDSGDQLIPVVASHGSASWVAEGGSYQESDETFGQITIGAHKLGTMIKISEEL